MKAEISVPNPVFEAAQQLAQERNMSLSEFYTAALAAYVATCRNDDITRRLDEVYATEESAIEGELVAIQVASIGEEQW